MPPERKLVTDFGVSITSVKKAILNLVNQGYLYRVQGKGTYVAGTRVRRESIRYYRCLREFNEEQAHLEFQLRSLKKSAGKKRIKKLLGVNSSMKLFILERLCFCDGSPLLIARSFLPEEMFPDLERCPKNFFETNTLYEALEERFGVTTVSNKELFGATAAEKKLAGLLNVPPGKELLYIEMLSYTYKEKPYEYRETYCLTDNRKIYNEL